MSVKYTIVLLPGLNGTEGLFRSLIDALPKGFDVITVTYPTHENKSYIQLRDLVLQKIQSIEGKYILLGESFSGPLSLFVAEQKPEGLIGVILVASFVSAPNVRIARLLPWGMMFSLTKHLYGLRGLLSKGSNTSFIKTISTELQKVSPEVLAFRIQEIFNVNASSALSQCEYPIMYFRGTNDFVVPKNNLKKILNIKPDLKVVEFNTQHFLLQSAPEQAWSEIKSFAESCA